jgi:hypothetical protein
MLVFRVHLADGDRRMKADLKATSEELARVSAERWFGDSPWQIIKIRQVV